MKRILHIFLALLIFLPAVAPAREPGPALWAVRDDDTTIYLFGTIHLLPKGTDWLKPATARAFDSADTLVLEVVAPEDPAELRPLILSLAVSPKPTPLKDRVGPAHAKKLEAIIRDIGIPMGALDAMDTWFAGLTLTLGQMAKLGFDPAMGVEEQLKSRAKPVGKSIVGLETTGEQLRLFDSLSEADQRAMLADTIDEFSEIQSKLGDMLRTWLAGDADGIGAQMNDDLRDSPHVAKLLLTDRNARWAEWIDKRMKQPGTVFIAVGAGHLAGPGSVQEMLAKHGLKAQRVE